MYDKSQYIIDSLDSLMLPATEDYSDISIFFKDEDFFLSSYHKNNPEETYTEPLGVGGIVHNSVLKACKELVSVNAYTEALRIYQTFIDKLECIADGLDKRNVSNIQSSIDVMQGMVLETMKQRDSYYSRRKSIISKYSGLAKDM